MCKIYIPFVHANNLYEIKVDFYKKHKIKTILVDLDNTLDSYKTKLPSEQAHMWKTIMENNDINIIITSNNTGKRVSTYANALGVKYWNSVGKPFATRLLKRLKENNIDPSSVIMIGDQTTTDIACANHAHIKNVLTDKLVKEDQLTTRFNRLFDRPIRKHLSKKNLLIDWRTK